MKIRLFYSISLFSIPIISCDKNPSPSVINDTGHIRSKVNGVEIIYSTPVENEIIHFADSDELHISFHSVSNKFLTWSIDITGVDFQNIEYPFVIQGPKESEFDEPAFWINIVDADPDNSAYGRSIVGTTSLYWNTKLTLTSFEEGIIKGTFEGEGVQGTAPAVFTRGEFLAKFK